MKRIDYPAPVCSLIQELKRLPGVGSRSAERIALWMMQSKDARPALLSSAILEATRTVVPCSRCGFFACEPLCAVCRDPERDSRLLCVVEQPTDILPLERSGAFRGLYHSLGGRISPLDHVGPDALRIESLLERVRNSPPQEVILALSADVEGEATSAYIVDMLRAEPVPVTRLAQGLPAGGGLEHADELTLHRALSGRTRA
ncbi:MAG: recombination protein RecR [Verrucomicrobiota bacterium]|jgi:recombination protein RecR